VGRTEVLVEPALPRSVMTAVLRPWHEKQDTIVYNQGLMQDQVALAILNRRLETRARAGGSFLAAHVDQQNASRSVDATIVSITPLDGNWQAALKEVRGLVADMLAVPPSQEEIAREVAEMNVIFESQVQQRTLQPGARLADDMMQAVDIHETVASPPAVQEIFKRSIPLFTPQAIMEHARGLFAGKVVRGLYVTPKPGEASEAALRAALLEQVAPDPRGRAGQAPISFAQLPAIGTPAPEPSVRATGMLGIEELTFANGVKVQLWPTKDDPGRVTVKVRFGAGVRVFRRRMRPIRRWAAWRWSARARARWGRKSWTASPPAASWASISGRKTRSSSSPPKPAPRTWPTSFTCLPPNSRCRAGMPRRCCARGRRRSCNMPACRQPGGRAGA
jgi:zinc protease